VPYLSFDDFVRHFAAPGTVCYVLSLFFNIVMAALWNIILVHGQVTIIFVVSVSLFVCAEFFSTVFDPISIKLGHMLYVWV